MAVIKRIQTDIAHAATWLAAGSPEAAAALAAAELVITATNSPEPLFGLGDVRGDAIVIALGSHTHVAQPKERLGGVGRGDNKFCGG